MPILHFCRIGIFFIYNRIMTLTLRKIIRIDMNKTDRSLLKRKILDKANGICYERFNTSIYDICGLDVNDEGYIREILINGPISDILTMNIGVFISNIPLLSQRLITNNAFGNKERALRQLYDNRIIITLMSYIDERLSKSENSDKPCIIDDIANVIVEKAIYLANY